MTSQNDKLRSLFLATLMVLSVFAGTVAFTGTAAAANNIAVTGLTNDEVNEGETVTHELTYTVEDVSADGNTDTFTVTLPASAEFAALNSLEVEAADGSTIDVTGGPSLQDANGGTNNEVTFDVSPESGTDTSTVTVTANFDVAWPTVEEETTGDVAFEVADSDGSTATLTAEDAVTILNDEPTEGEGANLGESTLLFAGQDAFLDTDLDEGTQNIRLVRSPDSSDDRTTVRPLRVDEGGLIQLDTSDLETDDYAIYNANTDEDLVTFEIIVQTLETEFDDESVDNDENTTLEVTSNRVDDFEIVVDVDGLSNDRLLDIFDSVDATENEDDEVTFFATDGDDVQSNFDDVNRGDYQFNFSVNDTTAESSADITVERAGTAELGLNESSYSAETGDTTNMTITFDDTDEGFIRIGDEDIGYNVTYEVVDGDEDGMLNVSLNTFDTADTDGGLSLAADEDGEVNVADDFDQTTVAGALDAGNYDIEVTRQEEDLGSGPDAVGTLAVTERGTTAARPWVTFSDAASDINRGDDVIAAIEAGEVTQRRNVAQGDFAVIQFEVSGIYGYLEAQSSIADAFGPVDTEDPDEPVSLQVEQSNPDPNTDPAQYDLDDLTYVLDDERNMLFVVVPTTGSGIPAEDGDQYNATLEVNAIDDDDVTLNDAKKDERVSTTFRVDEREAPLNTNAEDLVEIEQSEEATVSGTTTIAPGSEVTIRVRSVSGAENPFVMSETVNVSTGGTYNATFDFADTPVGTNFPATVSASPSLDGETDFDGVVVEAATETPTETDTPTPTDTPTATPTPTPTPTDGTDTATPTPTDTTTTTTPGFGAVVAIVALLGAALLALRRD